MLEFSAACCNNERGHLLMLMSSDSMVLADFNMKKMTFFFFFSFVMAAHPADSKKGHFSIHHGYLHSRYSFERISLRWSFHKNFFLGREHIGLYL